MKIIGIIKNVDESQEFRVNNINPSIVSPYDENSDSSEMGIIKETTYKVFDWNFPEVGRIKIAPYDDITNEILLAYERTERKRFYFSKEYYKIRLEYEGYKLYVSGMSFYKKLKFLFTGKIF